MVMFFEKKGKGKTFFLVAIYSSFYYNLECVKGICA